MKISRQIGRIFLFSMTVVCGLDSQGCCHSPKVKQPTPPETNRAWVEEKQSWGGIFIGPFFLRKGESTENGKLGVKVIDVIPGRCRSAMAEYPDPARVVLQFYEPQSKGVFCQLTLDDGSNTSIVGPEDCGNQIDISVVGMIAINTDDKWAVFDLRK